MAEQTVAVILVVLVPVLCVHFSLLAYAEAARRLGGRNPRYTDWRNARTALPLVFYLLWAVLGYSAATSGEKLLDQAVYQAKQCAYSAGRTQEAERVYPMRSVGAAYVLLFGASTTLLSALVAKRYARDRGLRYGEMVAVWLVPSLIYCLVVGLEAQHAITGSSILSCYCMEFTTKVATGVPPSFVLER